MSAELPPEPPTARNGELHPLVLLVELSTAQPQREALERWTTIIKAVGSVADQDVKVVDISAVASLTPFEDRVTQYFREGLDDFKLTPSEQRITELAVMDGKTAPEIAEIMALSPSYIRNVLSRVLNKTGADNRAGLAFTILHRRQ